MEILIQYKARNFSYILDSLPAEANFSTAFIRLCKSITNGETELTRLFLDGQIEDAVHAHESTVANMKLLQPLFDDEYFKMSILFLLAVENKNIVAACEVFQRSKYFLLNLGRNLNFSGCMLPEIQSFFPILPIDVDLIVEVNLNYNRLTILDKSLSELPNLTKLSVSNNKLWLVSSEILSAKNLLHLDLSYNMISELPAMNLSRRIKFLFLQGNQFCHFPSCLENSWLIELNLSRNKLVELSPAISTIKSLRKLDLSFNPYLLKLPTALGKIEVSLNLEGTESLLNIPYSSGMDIWAFYNQRLTSEVIVEHTEIVVVDACHELEIFNAGMKSLETELKDSPFIQLTGCGIPVGFQHVHEVLIRNPSLFVVFWQLSDIDFDSIAGIIQYLETFDPDSLIHIVAILNQNYQLDEKSLREGLNLSEDVKLHSLTIHPSTDKFILDTSPIIEQLKFDASSLKKCLRVPGCYTEIQEQVRIMRKKIKANDAPIISKSDFWERIRASLHNSDLLGIPELGTIIEFLEDTGMVSYFPSNLHGCEDLIFLDRDWIVRLVEHIIGRSTHSSLYINSYTLTQLGLEELVMRFSNSSPPAGLYYFLAQNALAMPLDQNSWFVPSVLTPEHLVPIPNSHYTYFAINYQPLSLWVRLIAHILNCLPFIVSQYTGVEGEGKKEDMSLVRYRISKWGILVQRVQHYILRLVKKRNEVLDSDGIEISVPNTDSGYQVLKILYSYMCSLLTHWYPQLVVESDVWVYCPVCVENELEKPYCFCWKVLLPDVMEDVSMVCPNHPDKVHISTLVPSFYPEDISFDIITQSSSFKFESYSSIPGLRQGTFGDTPALFKEHNLKIDGTLSQRNSGIDIYSVWAEIEIYVHLQLLKTPFLHKIVAYSTKPLTMALEAGPISNLDWLIFERKFELNYNFVIRILCQVCEAMFYLHKSKIMHRNICPESVLVCSLSNDTEINVKLGRFENAAATMFVGYLKQKKGVYPAPEMLLKDGNMEYEERSDVFSFGFLIYEVCTSLRSFEYQREKIEELISYGFRPNFPKIDQLAYGITALMEACWRKSPAKRPFAEDAMKYLRCSLTTVMQSQHELGKVDSLHLADITQDSGRNLVIAHGNKGNKLELMNSITLEKVASTQMDTQFIVALACARNFIFLGTIEENIFVISSHTLDILHTKEFESVIMCFEVAGDVVLAGDEKGRVTIFDFDTMTGNLSKTYQIEANSNPIKSIQVFRGKVYSTSKGFIHVFSLDLMEMKHYSTEIDPQSTPKEIQGMRLTMFNDCLHFFNRREIILHTWDAVKMRPLNQVSVAPHLPVDRQKQKHYIMSMESCDPWIFLGLSTGYLLAFSTADGTARHLSTFHIHGSSLRCLQILNINSPPSAMLLTLGEGYMNLPMVKKTGRTLTLVKESFYRTILDIFPVLPRNHEIERRVFQKLSSPLPPLEELDNSSETDYYEPMQPRRQKFLKSKDFLNSMSIDLDPSDFLDTPPGITFQNSIASNFTTSSFDTTSSSNISDN